MRKKPKGKNDPILFKNLKTSMNIKNEHKKMLGDFIIQQGYKLKEGKDTKSFAEVGAILKEIAINLKKLKESYEK
jgi:hypothetical protein